MKRGWNGSETKSYRETISLGENLSYYLETGDVIGLTGDLASGKTTFIKGLLSGLKFEGMVNSPTFTLINEYNASPKIIHIDCYREHDLKRWVQLGIFEYFSSNDIVLIEWPDIIKSILPDCIEYIKFRNIDKNKRRITTV